MDIVERKRIERQDVLEQILDLLCSSVGSLTNPTKIATPRLKLKRQCFIFSSRTMKKRKTNRMSKYNSLWEYVRDNGNSSLKMTFEQIQQIAGIPIDHSFLKYKKELTEYGYKVEKISMKGQTVIFSKIDL